MKNMKLFGMFALIFIIASSCAKYDEGSNFSLLTAKQRLVNTWFSTKYEVNGVEQTDYPALEVVFYKDFTFKRTFTAFFSISDSGTWEFGAGKQTVNLKLADGTVESYKILQLKNNDLKVEREFDGSVYRYTFKGK